MITISITESDGYEMDVAEFGYVSDIDREEKLKQYLIEIFEGYVMPEGSFEIKVTDTGEEE